MLEWSDEAWKRAPVARLLFWIALAFALYMALNPHPPEIANGAPDKLQHMAAFGTLTVLAVVGFPRTPTLVIGERLSFVGALIEVIQSVPSLHRDCDILDWVADTVVIVGVLAVLHLHRHRVGSAPGTSRRPASSVDQRAAPRLLVFRSALVQLDGAVETFHLLNVSPSGALCHMSPPPRAGTLAAIDVLGWKMNAHIVWTVGERFGLSFEREISGREVDAITRPDALLTSLGGSPGAEAVSRCA